MMTRTTQTLGQICDEIGGTIRTGPFGTQLHESDYCDVGIPVVMPQNIVDGKVSTEGIARIGEEDADRLSQHRLKPGDIVYGRRGDIGRRALITQRENSWLCGTGCFRLSLGDSVLEPKYLFYYLGQTEVIGWIYNQAIGATLPNLNTSMLRSVPITYPPLPVQRKSASILSAYDDLIENNTRRIKILEEMAQAIYREWFVNFRFPGHERVRMVDSVLGPIPEGWEAKSLGKILTVLESGSRPKGGVSESSGDVPSIGAENILGLGQYDYSKDKYVTRAYFESMRRGHVQDMDVVLYKDGAHIGKKSVFGSGFPHDVGCVNEHVFILRTDDRCSQCFLYFWLDQPEVTQQIRNLNANAAQPGINQAGVRSLPILLPPRAVIDAFDEICIPVVRQVFNLARKNNNLRRTRDLLLPRLVSGALDVSDLDIETEEPEP